MNKENGNSKIDLKTPVMVIQFGKQADNTRVRNGLEERGIHCIGDLCLWQERQLLKIQGIGYLSVETIRRFLKEHGLCLGMTEEELAAYVQNTKEVELLERMESIMAEFLPVLAGIPDKTQALKDVFANGNSFLEATNRKLEDLLNRLNDTTSILHAERMALDYHRLQQEKELQEQRRYELAKEIYLKEKGCFLSGWQKACRAVHKADLLLEALKEA